VAAPFPHKQVQAVCRCGKAFRYLPSRQRGEACSLACAAGLKRETYSRARFESGTLTERRAMKWFVVERDGEECSGCGLAEWRGLPLVLELDHRDGNASNNSPNNLRLLCPNCHAQTPSWGGRNRGSGRRARGMSAG
jgi:5-methylcytosine-specific restriction endonuclease McrA